MDPSQYASMADLDDKLWWSRARREILDSVLARELKPQPARRILEIGCGTGFNLSMLAKFGTVDGVELYGPSREIASRRLGRPVVDSRLPELSDLPAERYDLIALLDVLEHIEDDRSALAAIAKRLNPGGRVLLTIPQHPWMWTDHDEVCHHFRRYTKTTLREAAAGSGLKFDLLQSFNSLLFPLAAADRLVARMTDRKQGADTMPSPFVNGLFESIFGFERHMIGRVPMPPGVSLIALLSHA